MAACSNCGTALPDAAAACPNCGRLTAARKRSLLGPSAIGVVGGVFAAVAACLAFVNAFRIVGEALPLHRGAADCTPHLIAIDGLMIAMIAVVIGALIVGIRAARHGRPRLAAFLIVTAALLLVPASTCGGAIIAVARC